MVNIEGYAIPAAMALARKDSDIRQKFFRDPVSMEAGVAAAQQMLLAGAAASSHQPPSQSALQQEVSRLRNQLAAHRAEGKAAPKKGAQPGKAAGGGPPLKPKPKKGQAASRKAEKQASYMAAVKAGKCFKHYSPGGCKVYNCQYAHDCTVCGKKGCSATKHTE